MMQDLFTEFCHAPKLCKIKNKKSCTEKMSNKNKSHMLKKKVTNVSNISGGLHRN